MPRTISTSPLSSATTDLAHQPRLDDEVRGGVRLVTDAAARASGWIVAFSDRDGGVSRGPYSSLNLGDHVGDDPSPVAANRRRVARTVRLDPSSLTFVRQVHGADVATAEPARSGAAEADALIVRQPGVTAAILTADCVPVIVAGGSSMAVVHAGWRGLVAGVIERALDALGDVEVAWVGPSIAACCYEVGPEVTEAFAAAGLPVTAADRVDPKAAAASILHREGVAVSVSESCTSCDSRYFSHRRDGITGRQGAFAALVP